MNLFRHIPIGKDWAADPSNLLLFTRRQKKGTLVHHIMNDHPDRVTLQVSDPRSQNHTTCLGAKL